MVSRALAVLFALVCLSTLAGATDASAVERALAYMATKQRNDGRWDLYTQGYIVEALDAASVDPKAWPSPSLNAFSALTPETCSHLNIPSERQDCVYKSVLRIVHAAGASGYDPRALNGLDGVAAVREGFVAGQFGQAIYVNDDMWAILALRAAGVPADDAMVRAGVSEIWAARAADGGWGERVLAPMTSVDTTGMALAALAAAEEDLAGNTAARDFILTHRHSSGGYRSLMNGGPNCQSTVWAIHSFAILNATPDAGAMDYLRGLQRDDGGFGISGTGNSDLFCTTEAIPILAGERYPFPRFQPLQAPSATIHAGQNAALAVDGFERATWTFSTFSLEGTNVSHRFERAGTYAYALHASTANTTSRATGMVTVLSARPEIGALPDNVTVGRRDLLTLDLSQARDPDGRIEAFGIDWGDGNTSSALSHAFERAGSYTILVRARDDAGVWSLPASMRVDVLNRAPILAPLPSRLVANRVDGVHFLVAATDPDGDALEGVGRHTFKNATLGNHTVEVVVRDPFGATARANVTIEVLNLPPRVEIVETGTTWRASATDLDGPAPTIEWWIDGVASVKPPSRAQFAPGTHTLRALATDADGARTDATISISINAPARPPSIRELDASLSRGTLTVVFDAIGNARIAWETDAGTGERVDAQTPTHLDLPDATWARVSLSVERDGLVTTQETGLIAAMPEPGVAPPVPVSNTRVVAQQDAQAHEVLAPTDAPLQASAVKEPARAIPLPWWAALAAALVAMHRRRAA